MTKTMTWAAGDAARPFSATALYLVAAVLRTASDALARSAERRAAADAAQAVATVGTVEFHGLYRDAGAPEGALYVDGVFVGMIEGVTRL
jgi:hypothetical protein